MSGDEGGGAACPVANIGRKGSMRRMAMGAVVAFVAAGALLAFDGSAVEGPLGRWWRLALVPLLFFSALCVFQAQEET
jgi:hypothetical protein